MSGVPGRSRRWILNRSPRAWSARRRATSTFVDDRGMRLMRSETPASFGTGRRRTPVVASSSSDTQNSLTERGGPCEPNVGGTRVIARRPTAAPPWLLTAAIDTWSNDAQPSSRDESPILPDSAARAPSPSPSSDHGSIFGGLVGAHHPPVLCSQRPLLALPPSASPSRRSPSPWDGPRLARRVDL